MCAVMFTVFGLVLIFLVSADAARDSVLSNPNPDTSDSLTVSNVVPFPWNNSRLPTDITPEYYHISIKPDLDRQTFSGQVRIRLSVQKNTSYIILNSKRLQITEAVLLEVASNESAEKIIPRILQEPVNEQLGLLFQNVLCIGRKYVLTVSFSAKLASSFSGFYKAFYQTRTGMRRMLAATHFEPIAARTAFPCFDEPSFKSIFAVTIIRDPQHKALSNMPKKNSVTRFDGCVEDNFMDSVKMSSYLVAFVVSDFVSHTTTWQRGIKVSVYTEEDVLYQALYAHQLSMKVLEFYENLFKIPYPLPKLDLVAIPDFESGAMENWGLITFRKTSLLYDPETSTLKNKLWVSLVTAHELAHQWFGNLVTMKWWNDLWLNEGFASYMEYFSISHLKPSWSVEDFFLIGTFYKALDKDSFKSSHPISVPVTGSAHIREMFDDVSYCKGASILRMLQHFLTKRVFFDGIVSYLRKHSYGNAHKDHLWEALSLSASTEGRPVNVKAIMDTWTVQKGYPLVSITLDGRTLKLTQQIFTQYQQDDAGFSWQIPFTYYTSNSPKIVTYLMKNREETVSIPDDVRWVKANVNSRGFYRVSYDPSTFSAIIGQLSQNHNIFSKIDRASLIDDAFYLASNGRLNFSAFFSLTLYLKREMEYLPIRMTAKHIGTMLSKFSIGRKFCIMKLLKEHIWKLFGTQMDLQTWSDSGTLPQQGLRVLLHSLAMGFRHRFSAEDQALGLFNTWMASDGQAKLPKTLRGLIFKTGIKKGGNQQWYFLLRKYQESVSSSDRLQMLSALARTRSIRKQIWLLKASLINQNIKSQDFRTILKQVCCSRRGVVLGWLFIKYNWDKLVKKFSLGSTYLTRVVLTVTSRFASRKMYNEVKKFFQSKNGTTGLAFYRQSLESIQVNIHWLKSNRVAIKSWLKRQYFPTYTSYMHCLEEK
ncbi:endoplasmic reticulum aminopeptidase 1-like [Protopterus annectens]|uniref:endoplasmic reticulum aminopeptidase 1-like n=1 Tax=Protopterus annectens TaxID=7888 RepID=UPI001CFBA0F1|nr:endoplasmic reticulum aminopeptidase 1-like [Protopterus annectens]